MVNFALYTIFPLISMPVSRIEHQLEGEGQNTVRRNDSIPPKKMNCWEKHSFPQKGIWI